MSPKVLTAAFAACLFLLVLSAKWATFDRYGSAMPDWDQWDAEAVHTLVPWFTNDEFLTHLFHPHNEHRVVLTKLQNLALVLLNGQWDARLEAVTNAALHAALAAALWLFGLRWLRAPRSEQRVASSEHPTRPASPTSTRDSLPATRYFAAPLLFLLTFALFGLPVAWQNVLGGFHSQQYWLVGLSFAAIVTLPFARSFSSAWWIGAVSGILVLGSMGSGFLALVAVAIVIGFRLVRRETTLRLIWPALLVSVLLVAIGVLTRQEVTYHAEMKAASVHDFVFSIVHSLQWPWRDRDWAALVLWLPWFVLASHVVRSSRAGLRPAHGGSETRPTPNSSIAPQSILALGGWVLLQLAATAYARGAGADYPASRYMDTLTLGTMSNALALAWLLQRPETRDQRLETRDQRRETKDLERPTPNPRSSGPSSAVASPRSPVSSLWSLVSGLRFPVLAFLTLGWLLTLSLGLHRHLAIIVHWELNEMKAYHVNAESNMRRYLATNDPKHLAHKDIPFPNVHDLIERLAQPTLRALMPAPIRAPLRLEPATTATNGSPGFQPNTAIDADSAHPPRAGLSPTTPPLDYTTTWGSFHSSSPAPLQWTSKPLPPPLAGWLKFEVAGDLGPDTTDISLSVHRASDGTLLSRVQPTRIPRNAWRSAYVPAPATPFVVVATDASADRWLAFSPPVEMAPLSFWAWRLTKHSLLILYVTTAATALLALLALIVRARLFPGRNDNSTAATPAYS